MSVRIFKNRSRTGGCNCFIKLYSVCKMYAYMSTDSICFRYARQYTYIRMYIYVAVIMVSRRNEYFESNT